LYWYNWFSWWWARGCSKHEENWNMWCVSKVSVLIFYLSIYWTYLKLQVISFEVWPLGSYTVVPTFLPLIIAAPEVIFRVFRSSVTVFCMFSIVLKW
jgi:hypothetical protein